MARTPESDPEVWRIWAGLHRLLLRLAGLMPDEWLTHTREMLASGDVAWLPDAIAASVAQCGVSLTPTEISLLPQVLAALDVGAEPVAALDQVTVSPVTPPTDHRFFPASADVVLAAGDRLPPALDLTGGDPDDLTDLPDDLAYLDDLRYDLTDLRDSGLAAVMSAYPGVLGVWRAWRVARSASPETGRAVYLVEVEPGVPAWDLTHEGQGQLTHDGDESPQVEIYWSGERLTPYHRAARAGSALLWARESGPVRVVPLADPDGPRVSGARRDRLAAGLAGGVALSAPTGRTVDVLDPSRGAVVSAGYRTDGRWVWPEAARYYLDTYGLAPDARLVDHFTDQPPTPTVDGVGVFRAENALRRAYSGTA